MNNINQNKSEEKNNKIEYTTEQIQQILDILDSISMSGFINHQKMVTIMSIINEPFREKKLNNIKSE